MPDTDVWAQFDDDFFTAPAQSPPTDLGVWKDVWVETTQEQETLVRPDSEVLQGAIEAKTAQDFQEIEDTPPNDAGFERLLSQLDTTETDAPKPKSVEEALGAARERHAMSFPSAPAASKEIEQYADRLAMMTLMNGGLFGRDGAAVGVTPEVIEDLRGAFRYNLTVLNSEITDEEFPRVRQRAVGRISEMMQTSAMTKVQRLTQEIQDLQKTIGFDVQGTGLGQSADPERMAMLQDDLRVAQEDFAQAKELLSRSGEPKVQEWFMQSVGSAARLLKRNMPEDTYERDASTLTADLLDASLQTAISADWPTRVGVGGKFGERMNGVMARNLRLTDPGTGRMTQAHALEQILVKSFEGSLMQERLHLFNIPEDKAETLSPISMLVHTHPRQVGNLMEIAATNQGKRYAINDQRLLPLDQKIEHWKEEVRGPLLDVMFNDALSPLKQLRDQFDPSYDEGLESFGNEIDQFMASLGSHMMSWSRGAGDAVGDDYARFQGMVGEILEKGYGLKVDTKGKLVEASSAAAAAGVAAESSRKIDEAIQAGEDEAQKYVGDDFLRRHPNKWLGDYKKYFTQDNLSQLGLNFTSEEVHRLFNTRHNPLRVLALQNAQDIAANTLDKMAPLGFHPSSIRQAYGMFADEEFQQRLDKSLLTGMTEEGYQDMVSEQVRKNRGERPVGIFERLYDSVALSFGYASKEMRATAQGLLSRPDDMANIAAVTAGGTYLGRLGMKRAMSPIARRINRYATFSRASRVLEKAIETTPEAVQRVRSFTDKLRITGPNGLDAVLDSTTNALDYISDVQSVTLQSIDSVPNKTKLAQWARGQTAQASREAAQLLKHIDPRHTDELWDVMQLDQTTRDWLAPLPGQEGSMFGALKRVAENVVGYRSGNVTAPGFIGNAPTIFEKIARNPGATLEDLMVSPEALTDMNLDMLAKIHPEQRNLLIQAKGEQEALKWMSDFQKDTLNRRAWGAENRSNLEDWTELQRRASANDLRKSALVRLVDDEGGKEIAQRAKTRIGQAEGLRKEILDHGTPLDKTRVREHPLFEETEHEEIMSFLSARYGDHAIWDRMRKEFEAPDTFWDRVGNLTRRWDEGGEELVAEAAAFKKDLVKEFFEQPGLSDKMRVDILDGHISNRRLRRNLQERKAVGSAWKRDQLDDLRDRLENDSDKLFFDEIVAEMGDEFDKLAAGDSSPLLYGAYDTRRGVKSAWEEMQRRANTAGATRARTLNGISGEAEWGLRADILSRVTDGKARTATLDAAAHGIQTRQMVRAYTAANEGFQKAYFAMSASERQLFDAATVLARDMGTDAPLRVLRKNKRFEKYFQDIDPDTPDAAVQALWDRNENFRKNFLRDMAGVGAIRQEEFDHLIGPWGPRIFTRHELPRLYGTDGVDLDYMPSGIDGHTLGELSAQRHISKYKAQVYPTGGRPITQLFDSKSDAEAWLETNHGFAEWKEHPEAGAQVGFTPQGSKYALLNPLGDRAEKMGADQFFGGAGPGSGMFLQMRRAFEDMVQVRYFNSLDRPGIALSAEQHARLAPREARKFTGKLPDDPRLGALAGKHVHRGVARQMGYFSEFKHLAGGIADSLEDRVLAWTMDNGLLLRSASLGYQKLNNWIRSGIAKNLIARNPATVMGNFLSDTFVFSRLAAGPEINTTAKGWRLGHEAFKTIRGVRSGKLGLDELPTDIQKAWELGVIDEGILENAGLASARRVSDVEAIMGQLGKKHVWHAPFSDPRVKQLMAREEMIRRELQDDSLSLGARQKALAELASIQSKTESALPAIQKTLARAADVVDVLTGASRGRFGDVEGVTTRFYGDLGNTNRLRAYLFLVREKGFSPEAAANQVNRYMQTYSRIGTHMSGQLLQSIGRSPLGSPIVSFPFELVRISSNVLMNNPGAFAGMMASAFSQNMMAYAVSGVDPYRALEELGVGENPMSLLNFLHQRHIPLPGKQSLVLSNPAFAGVTQLMQNYGVTNGLAAAWDDLGDQTPLSKAVRVGTSLLGNAALSNPIVNFAGSILTKRDGMYGNVNRSGSAVIGDAFKRLAQPLIHPYAPIVGSVAERLGRAQESFPLAYTGRVHSMLNVALSATTGVKVRGDIEAFLQALPASVGDPVRDVALSGTKALAVLSLLDVPTNKQVLGEGRAMDWNDYFSMVVAKSAYADPQNGSDLGTAYERSFTMMRQAAAMRESDPARAKALYAQAEKEMIELRSTVGELGLGGREATPREIRNLVTRLLKLGDGYEESLETFSVQRRAVIVGTMLRHGDLPDNVAENLYRQYLFSKAGSLRGPANAGELFQTERVLREVLQSPRLSEENAARVETMLRATNVWREKAEVREMIEEIKVEKYRRTAEFMKEMRGE